MRRWIRLGLDVVLPRACPTCDRPLPAGAPSPLCAACRAAIVVPAACPCARCGGPAPPGAHLCVVRAALPRLRRRASARAVSSAGDPRNVLARAVQHLKYHGRRGAGRAARRAARRALPASRRRAPRAGPAAPVAAARAWLQPGAAPRARASRAAGPRVRPATPRAHAAPRPSRRSSTPPHDATNVRGAFALRRGARPAHRASSWSTTCSPPAPRPTRVRARCSPAARAACTSTPSAGHRDARACGRAADR